MTGLLCITALTNEHSNQGEPKDQCVHMCGGNLQKQKEGGGEPGIRAESHQENLHRDPTTQSDQAESRSCSLSSTSPTQTLHPSPKGDSCHLASVEQIVHVVFDIQDKLSQLGQMEPDFLTALF
ncbi:hypothetical protein KUCAC02_000997, partial [Chaenocephalus aceratus]